jgi:hypothetical protein
MVDPFRPASVLQGRTLSNRKILFFIFLPLLIFGLLSLGAFIISVAALNRANIHPDCACRKLVPHAPEILVSQNPRVYN